MYVVSPAEGPVALATLQLLLGIRTWSMHDVFKILNALK